MKKILTLFLVTLTLLLTIGCNKEQKILSLSPVDSLGWDEDYGFIAATGIEKIGNYYIVSDFSQSEISLFDVETKKYAKTISKKGNGPKEVYLPFGVEKIGKNVVINDLVNRRVKEIDLDGNVINNFSGIQTMKSRVMGNEIYFIEPPLEKNSGFIKKINDGKAETYIANEVLFTEHIDFDKLKQKIGTFEIINNKFVVSFLESSHELYVLNANNSDIEVWNDFIQTDRDNPILMSSTGDFLFVLIVEMDDIVEPQDEYNHRLVKLDKKGNVVSTAILDYEYEGTECFKVIDNQLFIFEQVSSLIKIYDLSEM